MPTFVFRGSHITITLAQLLHWKMQHSGEVAMDDKTLTRRCLLLHYFLISKPYLFISLLFQFVVVVFFYLLTICLFCSAFVQLFVSFPDTNNMTIYYEPEAKGVFHAAVTSKRYQLNYYEAQRLCEINRATLATYDQLFAAWEVGLELCL